MLSATHDVQSELDIENKENECNIEYGKSELETVPEEEGLRYYDGFLV